MPQKTLAMSLFLAEPIVASVVWGAVLVLSLDHLRLVALLIGAVLAACTFELLTCYGATKVKEQYPWMKHIGGKLMILSLMVPALILDTLMVYASELFPGVLGGFWINWMPVTLTSMLWIFVAQSLMGIEHVRRDQGDENVPIALIWALNQIKLRDERRMSPGQNANKRWWESLTQTQISRILDAKRNGGDVEKVLDEILDEQAGLEK